MEERSAGAILFNDVGSARKYLLLKYPAGHWDFPKGNVEKGESEGQTVLREVNEETGLDEVKLIDGFRRKIEYFYRRENKSVHKEVVFLLAETNKDEVKLSGLDLRKDDWLLVEIAVNDICHQTNPKPCKAADFERIFREAL